jgi:hypothetical protein
MEFRMNLFEASKGKSTVSDEAKRKVRWIQERPNVWRVVYLDQMTDSKTY